jgi:radical SAM protein with 4Fe4S-binding SPASM domain
MTAPTFIPLTVSWNLTKRCNLACAHCYIDAGIRADRTGELDPAEALGVLDQIAEVNPQAVLILTGGEPLLRKDIYDLIAAASRIGFWTVLGSHGGMLDGKVAERLQGVGLKGVGVSLDSVDAERHDAFRGIAGAWARTMAAVGVMREVGLPFLVETTVTRMNRREVRAMAELAVREGATALNVFFLVPTGRGASLNDLSANAIEEVLVELGELQEELAGTLMVNAKCAPHYRRVLWERDPESKFVRTFHGGGCPAGTYYCRITPEGDLTPCPYMPLAVGNLRDTDFATLWKTSSVLEDLRTAARGGRCGSCEFGELCGGCRCRAYATSGDLLAEDPSCRYTPGAHGGASVPLPPERTYGAGGGEELPWTAGARARIDQIPFFARGMVRRAVEAAARRRGAAVITEDLMQSIRDGMKGRFPLPGRRS